MFGLYYLVYNEDNGELVSRIDCRFASRKAAEDEILKNLNAIRKDDVAKLLREMVDCIKGQRKVEAIKKVREMSGLGLKDSKDFVETIYPLPTVGEFKVGDIVTIVGNPTTISAPSYTKGMSGTITRIDNDIYPIDYRVRLVGEDGYEWSFLKEHLSKGAPKVDEKQVKRETTECVLRLVADKKWWPLEDYLGDIGFMPYERTGLIDPLKVEKPEPTNDRQREFAVYLTNEHGSYLDYDHKSAEAALSFANSEIQKYDTYGAVVVEILSEPVKAVQLKAA